VLRRIVAHWISGPSLADFKAELAAVWRVGVRRARERREADAEAWRALAGMQDDEQWNAAAAALALCREWLRLGGHAAHRVHKPR